MTVVAPAMSPEVARAGHYRPSAVLRSEWTKLRSVRSTTWSLLAMTIASVGIGIIATATEASRWSHAGPLDRLTFDPTSLSLTGLLFGQLAIGILGVLAMSAEFGTGTIRATLAAVPDRKLVVAAKAAVFVAVAFTVGEIVAFGSFFIGQAVLTGSAPHAALGDPGVLRAVFGGGLYIAVLGLLALGLATIIRHTAGAITAFVSLLLVVPIITHAFPTSVSNVVDKYLPSNIGATLMTVHPGFRSTAPAFGPWVGFALLCGYTAAALGIGAWLLVRSDA